MWKSDRSSADPLSKKNIKEHLNTMTRTWKDNYVRFDNTPYIATDGLSSCDNEIKIVSSETISAITPPDKPPEPTVSSPSRVLFPMLNPFTKKPENDGKDSNKSNTLDDNAIKGTSIFHIPFPPRDSKASQTLERSNDLIPPTLNVAFSPILPPVNTASSEKECELLKAQAMAKKLQEENERLSFQVSKQKDLLKRSQVKYERVLNQMIRVKGEFQDLKSLYLESEIHAKRQEIRSEDFDGNLAYLKGELDLNCKVFEKELLAVILQYEEEISKISNALHDNYREKLQTELQKLKKFCDKMNPNNRDYEDEEGLKMQVLQLQTELVEEGVGESGAAEETREIRNRMQLLLKNVTDLERKLRGLTDEIENLEREKEQQCQKYEVLPTTKENSKQRWNNEKVKKTSSDTDQDLMDLHLEKETDTITSLLEKEKMRLKGESYIPKDESD